MSVSYSSTTAVIMAACLTMAVTDPMDHSHAFLDEPTVAAAHAKRT